MNTFPVILVFLFMAMAVGMFAGFILGSLCATATHADAADPFLEHECDAHYPRIGD
ncbi:hypothetical protein [Paraburkholderia xenovorans]|uniref:hypothetical protein n=1 Tax=Paraburkholderia xenovorans TaxID=36873 RepID=UPI0015C52A41|nr:hypothetical protein [Paraburkholderia xenovorans]NPT38546.1 hypothetical protein [Paraburkholderia xenovorans]